MLCVCVCVCVCSMEDAGRFTCVAENEAGHDSINIDLTVHGLSITVTCCMPSNYFTDLYSQDVLASFVVTLLQQMLTLIQY